MYYLPIASGLILLGFLALGSTVISLVSYPLAGREEKGWDWLFISASVVAAVSVASLAVTLYLTRYGQYNQYF